MPLKFDGTIKLDINIVITASFMIYFLIANNATNQEISEIKPAVEKIPEETKEITKADLIKILERINIQSNTTKLSQLSQDQILKISNQILRAVR